MTFFVAFKDLENKADWFTTEAHVHVALQQRSVPTRNGDPTFFHFDSATMTQLQYPTKATETVFCRRQPQPLQCETNGRGFDMELVNFPTSVFEVKKSGAGDNAGRGVYAKVDIPAPSYLAIDDHIHVVFFGPSTMAMILDHCETSELMAATLYYSLMAYIFGYGFQYVPHVSLVWFFVNRRPLSFWLFQNWEIYSQTVVLKHSLTFLLVLGLDKHCESNDTGSTGDRSRPWKVYLCQPWLQWHIELGLYGFQHYRTDGGSFQSTGRL